MAKSMLLVQLLVLQTAYVIGIGLLESDWLSLVSFPENCKPGLNCAYEPSIKYDPIQNAILLDVIGPCNDSLAVAIGVTNDNKNLKGIDVVWGLFKDGHPLILHGHMSDSSKAPVVYKDQNGLLNPTLTKKRGLCHLHYAHPRVPKIQGDFKFMDKDNFYVVLAKDGLTINKDGNAVGFPKRPLVSNLISMEILLSLVRERTPEFSFVYPSNCDKTNSCVYVVNVKLDKEADLVRVSIVAKITDKKMKMCSGIGFSRNRTMIGMDFVYSCQNNKTYHVLFENSAVKFRPYPTLDLPEATVVQKDGHLTMNFAHRRRPSNEGDFCFVEGECYYFWYPYSGLTMLDSAGGIDLKNVKSVFSQHKMCIECPEETTTMEPMTTVVLDDTTIEPETTCDHETTVEPETTEILIETTEGTSTPEVWTTEEASTPESYEHPTPSPHDDIKPSPTSTPKPCTGLKGICYYNSSAQYRAGLAKFTPKDMLTSLCSHAIFCCAKILDNKLIPGDSKDTKLYKEFNDRKLTEPKLKTFLAVGGHNFPIKAMTTMLSTSSNRKAFIDSTIDLLKKYKFDGLDLHCDVVEIKAKQQFTLLIQELRTAFNKTSLLLMVSVCAIVDKITCDVKTIHKYVDLMHLKAYDYHSSQEKVTALNAPLFHGSTDQGPNVKLNIDYSANYMVTAGIPKLKLIIGMPLYGLGYTLTDPENHDLSAPVIGPSRPGNYTLESGFLSYYEICLLLRNYNTKTVWLDEQKVTYLYFGNQWISYDDERSLTEKINWLKKNGYGGWAAWDMSLDDFHGDLCNKGPFPLIKLMKTLDDECHEIVTLPSTTLSKILSSTTTKPLGPTTKSTTRKPVTLTSRTTFKHAASTTKTTTKSPVVTTTKTSTKSTPVTDKLTKYVNLLSSTIKPATSTKTTKKVFPVTSTTTRTTSHSTMATTTPSKICTISYGLVKDPNDCRSYFLCSDGKPTKKRCQSNLYFNPESKKCEDASHLSDERKRECDIPN